MMSVERKFQPVREIEPFAKHIILTNHLPRISDYSDGLFRRVSIIPLQRQFLGASADPLLINKLTGGAGCDYITRTRRTRAAH